MSFRANTTLLSIKYRSNVHPPSQETTEPPKLSEIVDDMHKIKGNGCDWGRKVAGEDEGIDI